MQAVNYVKEFEAGDIKLLTKSGVDLAKLAVASCGGIHKAAEDTGLANGTIQRIVHGGKKGSFWLASWETFFNTLILKKAS